MARNGKTEVSPININYCIIRNLLEITIDNGSDSIFLWFEIKTLTDKEIKRFFSFFNFYRIY